VNAIINLKVRKTRDFFGQEINDRLQVQGSYVWKSFAYMSILRNILYKKWKTLYTVLQMLYLHSVLFELEINRTPKTEEDTNTAVAEGKHKPTLPYLLDRRRGSQGARSILLKGQMKYIDDIKAIVFLCSPM